MLFYIFDFEKLREAKKIAGFYKKNIVTVNGLKKNTKIEIAENCGILKKIAGFYKKIIVTVNGFKKISKF